MRASLLLLLPVIVILGCSRKASEPQANLNKDPKNPRFEKNYKHDFDFICQSQKTYVQALKMKGVPRSDLANEHSARLLEGIEKPNVRDAVATAISGPEKERRKVIEAAARAEGLGDWTCPELDTFPL